MTIRTASYSEAAYFDGEHCQHIADYEEHRRVQRIRDKARQRANEYRARFPNIAKLWE